ncbi:MAG: hypothetical protein ABSG16_08025 [Candidatus Acidiferrum sp.]|jgi:hypothetical protein
MNIKRTSLIIAAAALVTVLTPEGRADSFDVSLNTSSFSGSTQILAFGLNDSDGSSNTISLTGFNFGGGSALSGSQDCTLGGALSGAGCSGNLTGGVTLSDATTSEVFFDEEFNVGSALSFAMTTTNNFAGGIPDGFAMYLCNTTFTDCYSDDLSTTALLVLGLGGTALTPASFTLNGASAQDLPAPVVTVPSGTGTTPIPEPGTFVTLSLACLAMALCSRRLREPSAS